MAIPFDAAIVFLGYLSKENQNDNSLRSMHPYVHGSTIYYSQDMEAI